MRIKDLSNQIFGRLTAIRVAGRTKQGRAMWLCRCSCSGIERVVRSGALVVGNTASCGCLHRESAVARLKGRCGKDSPTFKHGHALASAENSPTYSSWKSMIQRTTNPNNPHWATYGGAGITICDGWRDFENFLADLGERPAGTSLGRFGDIGNYEKSNCAWQTDREQKLEQKKKRQLQKDAA